MTDTQQKTPIGKRLLNWAINIALVLVAYFAIQSFQTRDAPTSGAAPELSGFLLDGTPVRLSQFLGKPVLVHFWATWCTVCRLEQSNINNIAEDHVVLTIASQSGGVIDVQKYVDERKITLPVIADSQGRLAKLFGIKAYPTTFIVDANGQISDAEVGYSTELGLRFRLWWAAQA